MKVGTAWEDITPATPLPLMGQMHVRLGEYARDRLTVNGVVFDDGTERVAVVSVGVCIVPDALAPRLHDAVAAACEIDSGKVVVAATHTHVAPCTTERIVGEPDPAFLDRLERATANAVRRAIDDLAEADLYAGAAWPEREIMEMFGIQVTGHPDPRKLLLPQDWEGYPLRKDYRYPSEHPYLSPDPLREDPVAVLGGGEPAAAEAETQEP